MAWDDVVGGVSRIQDSLIESQKFSRKIGRLFVGEDWRERFDSEQDLQRYLVDLCDSDVNDLTVFRLPSSLLDLINRTEFNNRTLLFSGTLVYWEIRLDDNMKISQMEDESIVTAQYLSKNKYSELSHVLETSFSNYKNHYTANPFLALVSATDTYSDWAFTVLENNPENVILVNLDGRIAGLAVISTNRDGPVEILLAGVAEDFQRRGAYTSLLRGVCRIAAQRGFSHVVISTQSKNIAVQKAWSKAGFSPALSIDTFHSMAKKLSQL